MTNHPDDLTLKISIHRPSSDNPEGGISLTAETTTAHGTQIEAGANGKHDDTTMKRVLLDVHSYLEHGRKSWVNLASDTRNRERSR